MQSDIPAIILARGGSKGIPNKNMCLVKGKSLLSRAIESCRQANSISRIFVSTDDTEIANEAKCSGAEIISRPDDLAGDEASSESGWLHAIYDQDLASKYKRVFFIQCTSPFIAPEDLDQCVATTMSNGYDVCLSRTKCHIFLWSDDANSMKPINHDIEKPRVRRQEFNTQYIETGAFYLVDINKFMQAKRRHFGKIGGVDVTQPAIEIDSPTDLCIANAIANTSSSN